MVPQLFMFFYFLVFQEEYFLLCQKLKEERERERDMSILNALFDLH